MFNQDVLCPLHKIPMELIETQRDSPSPALSILKSIYWCPEGCTFTSQVNCGILQEDNIEKS